MVTLFPNRNNNLSKKSVIDVFQLRSVSQSRLIKSLGKVTEEEFLKVIEATKIVFGIY